MMLGLLEAKVKEEKFREISSTCCPNWSSLNNYSSDSHGRIWLYWYSSKIHVTKTEETRQELLNKVSLLFNTSMFWLILVHALNTKAERTILWQQFCLLVLSNGEAWLVSGDFNNILFVNERIGDFLTHPNEILHFAECLNNILVFDHPYQAFTVLGQTTPKG